MLGPRRPLALAAIVVPLLSAACGPQVSLNLGLKESQMNVRFGAQHVPAPSPQALPPFVNPFPGFPVPFAASALPISLGPYGPSTACRDLKPTAYPSVPVSGSVRRVPAPAAYPSPYRATA